MTDLAEDEIVAWVEVPIRSGRTFGFDEFAARHGDYARAGAVCHVDRIDGVLTSIGAVLFAVGTRPTDVTAGLRAAVGTDITDIDWMALARSAVSDVVADRRRLAGAVLARALRQAGKESPRTGRAGTRVAQALAQPDVATAAPSQDRTRQICVTVNGSQSTSTVPARLTFADYLREHRGLHGTHLGCEQGVCGACTVLVDGVSMRSCLMLAVQADGHEVRTVEGLTPEAEPLHPLQQAFDRNDALQCGFCTPGFLMSGVELLRRPSLDESDVREALSGNLCRCTGYEGIVRAVLETHAAGTADPPDTAGPVRTARPAHPVADPAPSDQRPDIRRHRWPALLIGAAISAGVLRALASRRNGRMP
jgi:carbon-monoxide dehydrogenase small subunit